MTAPGPCDDGNPCTLDTCTPATGCQHTLRADGAPCPDGNFCNGTETCQAGTCTPGTPLVCDDGNVCTGDSCDPATGCVFTFACDDGNPCTADTCDSSAGCQHAAVADATPCPDGNLCNGAETCHAGVCTAGAAPFVQRRRGVHDQRVRPAARLHVPSDRGLPGARVPVRG